MDRAFHTTSCLPRTSRSALSSSQVLISWNDQQRIRPIGHALKGTSPSLNSITTSNVPRGTPNQFSGDSYNDDHRFAMNEVAHLCRMESTIQRLTTNMNNRIPGVVLKEDEAEDEDEDENNNNGGGVEDL
ncbi:hypothetical protein Adt_45269 [Abeliophyllum distichum]|uniref:Uncharacterized protein n=1 Tax=Abeliophyllum distichum TaxID=126358 RepID=A0ABD1PE00_9LAMI